MVYLEDLRTPIERAYAAMKVTFRKSPNAYVKGQLLYQKHQIATLLWAEKVAEQKYNAKCRPKRVRSTGKTRTESSTGNSECRVNHP